MSNVLDIEKQHQIRALGALGRSLRTIEAATGVRRETISAYLKAAGIPVRRRGGRPRAWPPNPATTAQTSTDSTSANPATTRPVSTDPRPTRSPQTSASALYRELIVEAVARGRSAGGSAEPRRSPRLSSRLGSSSAGSNGIRWA